MRIITTATTYRWHIRCVVCWCPAYYSGALFQLPSLCGGRHDFRLRSRSGTGRCFGCALGQEDLAAAVGADNQPLPSEGKFSAAIRAFAVARQLLALDAVQYALIPVDCATK